MTDLTIVKFKLPSNEVVGLQELARKRGVSVTQALRQAIATEDFIASQPSGSKVLIQDTNGQAREVIFRN